MVQCRSNIKNSRLCDSVIQFTVIFILMFPGTARSESLKALQDMAVANRKVVEKYRLDVRKGENDETIARSAFLPSVDATYTANRLDEDSTSEKQENSSVRGAITYNIFSGFKDEYNVTAAGLLKKAKEYELESIIQDIRYAVALRYLDIFGKKSSLKVAEDEYRLLQKRHEDSKNMYSVGLIKKNDLLKIKVQMDDADQRLKKAEAEFKKSVNRIERETDADVDSGELTFNEFDEIPGVKDFAFYESRMFEKRNEIKAIEAVLQSKEFGVKIADSAYYPSVDISGSYRKFGDNYAVGAGGDSDDEIRVQLNAKINLFDGYKKDSSVAKANLEVETAGRDLYELKKTLSTGLKNVLLDYEVSLKNLKVAESSISQADENLRITDISFKEGVETAADVLDAIYYLSRARYNFINAKNELFTDYYGLVRMTDDF